MRNESYRLATYARPDGVARAGIIVDQQIVDVEQGLGRLVQEPVGVLPSVMSILQQCQQLEPKPRLLAADIRAGAVSAHSPLSSVRLLPPLMYPGAIFCAGANY